MNDHNSLYAPDRFTVTTRNKENAPGTWESTIVTILDHGEPCGEYVRNYPSFAEATFAPFMIGDEWFALYSRDYTSTRLMRLPSCEDIGGEKRDCWGFCPTELYIPRYRLHNYDFMMPLREGETEQKIYHESDAVFDEKEIQEIESSLQDSKESLSEWRWCPFGFISGCIWGDDSSWKIQFLDLSRAKEGIVERQERFGYIELSDNDTLKDAVNMKWWSESKRIGIRTVQHYDLDEVWNPPITKEQPDVG
jgi:hypothetical protein